MCALSTGLSATPRLICVLLRAWMLPRRFALESSVVEIVATGANRREVGLTNSTETKLG